VKEKRGSWATRRKVFPHTTVAGWQVWGSLRVAAVTTVVLEGQDQLPSFLAPYTTPERNKYRDSGIIIMQEKKGSCLVWAVDGPHLPFTECGSCSPPVCRWREYAGGNSSHSAAGTPVVLG
jgi:hypothetical protein